MALVALGGAAGLVVAVRMLSHGSQASAMAGPLAGLGPAVFVHEGSTLLVIANTLRLLVYKDSGGAVAIRQA